MSDSNVRTSSFPVPVGDSTILKATIRRNVSGDPLAERIRSIVKGIQNGSVSGTAHIDIVLFSTDFEDK